MTEYLFVVGGYLRERLSFVAERYCGGDSLDIDYHRLFFGFEKIFYYDCMPPRRKEENENSFQVRSDEAQATFRKLRNFPGCHVFLGDTKQRRQRA